MVCLYLEEAEGMGGEMGTFVCVLVLVIYFYSIWWLGTYNWFKFSLCVYVQ